MTAHGWFFWTLCPVLTWSIIFYSYRIYVNFGTLISRIHSNPVDENPCIKSFLSTYYFNLYLYFHFLRITFPLQNLTGCFKISTEGGDIGLWILLPPKNNKYARLDDCPAQNTSVSANGFNLHFVYQYWFIINLLKPNCPLPLK